MIKDKNLTLAITGLRAQKLPWGFNENDKRFQKMKTQVTEYLIKFIKNGYSTFYDGMALGFDLIALEILIDLKIKYPYIKIIGAMPCPNQDAKWTRAEKERYKNIKEQIDQSIVVSEKYYGKECMLKRNRFIVDNSDMLFALWDGTPGGTMYTIEYAKSQNKPVVIIEP